MVEVGSPDPKSQTTIKMRILLTTLTKRTPARVHLLTGFGKQKTSGWRSCVTS
jgi:hypothetical protein